MADDPQAIRRRLSPFEQEQSALHYVIAPPDGLVGGRFCTGAHYRTLQLLIELGADLEAEDAQGRTPLAVAMLRADREAMRILHDAGARPPEPSSATSESLSPSETLSTQQTLAAIGRSLRQPRPMLAVPDMDATVAWYRAIGFELTGCHGEEGAMDWASVTLGDAEIMLSPSSEHGHRPTAGLSLWFETDRIDDLYALLKERQVACAQAALDGADETDSPEVRFTVDLHTAFYGLREFGIRDPNGIELMFTQPIMHARSGADGH